MKTAKRIPLACHVTLPATRTGQPLRAWLVRRKSHARLHAVRSSLLLSRLDSARRSNAWNHGPMHVFVDELERGGYLLAATSIRSGQPDVTRKAMRGLRLAGERRI